LAHDEFEEACQALNRMAWPEYDLDVYEKEAIDASVYRSSLEVKYEKGEISGIKKGKIAVARELLACGINVEIIAKSTGLSIDEINQLKQK